MQFKQSFNWFLLGFLVLLLNFGPSLHRAHFFGLHSHPADNQSCSHSSCCPGHDHSAEVPGIQSKSIESHHDCSFCKFFDQYHVVSLQILACAGSKSRFSERLFGAIGRLDWPLESDSSWSTHVCIAEHDLRRHGLAGVLGYPATEFER